MKHLFLGFTAASLLALTACGNNSETTPSEAITETTTEAKADFSQVYAHYEHLTSALSSDDANEATKASSELTKALVDSKADHLSEEDKNAFEPLAENIRMNAEAISNEANDIAAQRKHLDELSQSIYALAKKFGTPNTMYKIYCSMYDNDKGAFWLSSSKEVKNPYFGASMFSCGEVQEELN